MDKIINHYLEQANEICNQRYRNDKNTEYEILTPTYSKPTIIIVWKSFNKLIDNIDIYKLFIGYRVVVCTQLDATRFMKWLDVGYRVHERLCNPSSIFYPHNCSGRVDVLGALTVSEALDKIDNDFKKRVKKFENIVKTMYFGPIIVERKCRRLLQEMKFPDFQHANIVCMNSKKQELYISCGDINKPYLAFSCKIVDDQLQADISPGKFYCDTINVINRMASTLATYYQLNRIS